MQRQQAEQAQAQMMQQQATLEQAGQAAQVAGSIDEVGQDSVAGVVAGLQPQ
jgi:hypothetical protein